MIRKLLLAIFGASAIGLSGCAEDPTVGQEPFDGESTVTATVEFRPLVPALDRATRTAGDAIRSIRSLCVLLYDSKGDLVKKYPLTEGEGPGCYKVEEEERTSAPDSPTAEAKTPRATFTLGEDIPYGDYYIYAAANMGGLDDRADKIRTIEGLKSILLTWDQDDMAANDQMLGFFTAAGKVEKQAPLLRLNTKTAALHAWIRRAASKVTVAYDGSALEEGVFIYLKSVAIKDIPRTCKLEIGRAHV